MGTDQTELHRIGRLLHPEVTQFAEVSAVYHRGADLILEISPRIPYQMWLEALRLRSLELGFFVHLYEQNGTYVIVAKSIAPARKKFPWLNIVLAALTVASMVFSYSYLESGGAILRDPRLFLPGLSFMAALMSILTCHEFGHYFAGRYHKADVSLPYFIPAPTMFGTLGAFIKSRSPFKNRVELFDVGVAGPLAGFLPALAVLITGLATARVELISAIAPGDSIIEFGDSLLLLSLTKAVAPDIPEGYQIVMSPLVYAGWVGFFVTMMNLLPIGQLDGGHIVYALAGKRAHKYVAYATLAALAALGFLWSGWFVWAAVSVFVVKIKHPPTIDDVTPIDPVRKRIGWTAIAIFALTFVPVPVEIMTH
jgi:membrane-associated protease RseP (regulator of RpoE activity)